MNKSELKKFAVEARRDLIEKVSLKAEQYGINKENQTLRIEEKYGELVINGHTYPIDLKNALKTMESKLQKVGYEQLIEEVAYTWFNRVTAIRYMEVNGHLPERVNVLSSTTGKSEPDIIFDYATMELDIRHDEIRSLLSKEKTEWAYRTLFVAQCNALNKVMPFLFEQIEDYTELLLPDYLLDQQSIIRKITEEVSEENFYEIEENGSKKDNVEILGWLYQYYMSEKKEKVGGLKNNAVKKEDLPVVTQLFTPKWIVQYMVQNSLGKLYDEKYEHNNLSKHWEYYLKHEENHHLYPEFDSLEELKIMDPACGSGHILLYAFDMLYDMYQEAGYPSRDIPQLILENNLYGLDIDKRAQQIANFALLMKAVEKQPRLLSRLNRKKEALKFNVYEIRDADHSLSEEAIDYFIGDDEEKQKIKEMVNRFDKGKQFGSLVTTSYVPYKRWIKKIEDLEIESQDLLDESYIKELKDKLLPILNQTWLIDEQYDVVITNPPYHNKFNPDLKKFLNQNFEEGKSDLYSSFIIKTSQMTKDRGYSALMTPYTWMFISTHEKLRNLLLKNFTISSLVQLEYSAFEEATVPICTFVIQNQVNKNYGEFIRLTDFKGAKNQPLKLQEASVNPRVSYRYRNSSASFINIPGTLIVYWVSSAVQAVFQDSMKLGEVVEPRLGMATSNNDLFLRRWFEIDINKILYKAKDRKEALNSKKKWFPYSKGGDFRKWYGNNEYVVNWESDGYEIRNYKNEKGKVRSHNYNLDYIFREAITWSALSTGAFSSRYNYKGFLFDNAGSSLFGDREQLKLVQALLSTKLSDYMFSIINPTMNVQPGTVYNFPYKDNFDKEKVLKLSEECISLCKEDWDSFEISWDFKKHPFTEYRNCKNELAGSYDMWAQSQLNKFNKVKENENYLNELFINLYGLNNEISTDIDNKNISITLPNRNREVISFISYFIGCMVGRYSLDVEGLVYAGREFDEEKYTYFKSNKKGLVQFTEDQYFENDIIVRLKEFLSVAFSKDTVDENIEWLAKSLTMRKNESPEERLRRYFMDEFFKDHCKIYQKRPIYWLVDSGKQKGLRTLIYMHRYQSDTMATIRFEHLQEIQSKYQNEIEMLEIRLASPDISASDRRNLEKLKESYQKKIEELQEFDKKLAVYANETIDIDLDDGVKVNYAKFDDVLAKIK